MELNLDEIKERIRPSIQRVLGANAETPLGLAILEDAHLALFFIAAVDFVSSAPTAILDKVEVVREEGQEVDLNNIVARIRVPIPELFENFYQMRVRNLLTGSNDTSFTIMQEILPEERPDGSARSDS